MGPTAESREVESTVKSETGSSDADTKADDDTSTNDGSVDQDRGIGKSQSKAKRDDDPVDPVDPATKSESESQESDQESPVVQSDTGTSVSETQESPAVQ